jgi:hypothetical protein
MSGIDIVLYILINTTLLLYIQPPSPKVSLPHHHPSTSPHIAHKRK